MKILCFLLIGYLAGTVNPALLISKIKGKNLREHGTGNLGATNAMLVLGKKAGALVMLFDIGKSAIAVKLADLLAPELPWLSIATGLAVILGHCFPLYLNFKGGKGLAAFAGLVLAYQPLLFVWLLVSGIFIMVMVNYSFALPFYATVFFFVYVMIRETSILTVLLALMTSILIIVMHFGNLQKALAGRETKIREYIKTKMFHRGNAK